MFIVKILRNVRHLHTVVIKLDLLTIVTSAVIKVIVVGKPASDTVHI